MASTHTGFFIALGLFSGLFLSSNANEFLKAPHELIERVSEEDIRTSLLDEVEGTLGVGSASSRLSEMENTLKPIVAALPKNEHGNLGHAAVGYALHRLFVLRHGWVIKGLDTRGSNSSSSPAGVLKDQVPAFIEGLFEKRLAGKGFGLHEVSVLGATIEHLIHNEAVSRLGNAFNVHMLPVTSPISEDEASTVLDTYMMSYILGENLKNLTLSLAEQLRTQMPDIFLAWKDTQKFVRAIRDNVTESAGGEVDFASLAKVVDIVGMRFGSFQDLECHQLKSKLVNMEYRGTGRVKLSDFYRPALDGAWTFQESSGYLRSLGLLDESDASQPSVMIANYVTSQANCIASSGFYSVCCKNECDGLLGYLEEHIGTSEAPPLTISFLIENLPSSTAPARKLAASLRQRLDDIAANHQGMVPLHGRLMAQWLHHVYPRECPYPHVSGTTDSLWQEASPDARATEDEMKQFVEQSDSSTQSSAKYDIPVEELMPWSSEEELFVVRSLGHAPKNTTSPALRSMVLFAAAGSLGLALIQAMNNVSPQHNPEKYTV